MDVRENTARRDGDAAEELGELLVVAHGELDVARDDAGRLVGAGGVAGDPSIFTRTVSVWWQRAVIRP